MYIMHQYITKTACNAAHQVSDRCEGIFPFENRKDVATE